MKWAALAATTAAISLCACAAQAAAYTETITVDLTGRDLYLLDYTYTGYSPGTVPLTLEVGDTIDLTFDFLDDQQIAVGGINEALAALVHNAAGGVPNTQTGTLSFLDVGGNTIYTTQSRTKTDCCAAGLFYAFGDFDDAPTNFTFAGVRYQGTIDAFAGGAPSDNYFAPLFYFYGTDVHGVNIPDPVPEPSSWALLIAGFGLAGATLRQAGARAASMRARRAPTAT